MMPTDQRKHATSVGLLVCACDLAVHVHSIGSKHSKLPSSRSGGWRMCIGEPIAASLFPPYGTKGTLTDVPRVHLRESRCVRQWRMAAKSLKGAPVTDSQARRPIICLRVDELQVLHLHMGPSGRLVWLSLEAGLVAVIMSYSKVAVMYSAFASELLLWSATATRPIIKIFVESIAGCLWPL